MKVAFIVCDKTTKDWGYEGQCAIVIGNTETEIRAMIPGTWTVDIIIDAETPCLQHLERQFG